MTATQHLNLPWIGKSKLTLGRPTWIWRRRRWVSGQTNLDAKGLSSDGEVASITAQGLLQGDQDPVCKYNCIRGHSRSCWVSCRLELSWNAFDPFSVPFSMLKAWSHTMLTQLGESRIVGAIVICMIKTSTNWLWLSCKRKGHLKFQGSIGNYLFVVTNKSKVAYVGPSQTPPIQVALA